MKTLILLLTYAVARPGYHYEFPRDHYSHPEFQTEWWYYTGNLKDTAGRRFGFELTFFRVATTEDRKPKRAWDPVDVYVAHLTLSDVAGGKFHHYERVNRNGPGLAGASFEQARVWNGNWEVRNGVMQAVADKFRLRLSLHSDKPPVIHGENGLSVKAGGEGRASHYISFTRLLAKGELEYEGRTLQVDGTAWMDHEFFTNQLTPEQTGWDWFSIQLDSGEELMLVRIRRKDGSTDAYSSGTFVDKQGKPRHLTSSEFQLTPLDTWASPATKGRYPLRWRIEIPSLALTLDASTPLKNQELVLDSGLTSAYWEGAMDYRGARQGLPITGAGYLEMTGYTSGVRLGSN